MLLSWRCTHFHGTFMKLCALSRRLHGVFMVVYVLSRAFHDAFMELCARALMMLSNFVRGAFMEECSIRFHEIFIVPSWQRVCFHGVVTVLS